MVNHVAHPFALVLISKLRVKILTSGNVFVNV